MELILMVNLAFSIVGFYFIFRMWNEVKARRDEYGENFNIPRGKRATARSKRDRRPARDDYDYLDYYEEAEEMEPPKQSASESDLAAMMAEILKAAERMNANAL